MFNHIKKTWRTITKYDEKKRNEALRGETTSGHATPGDRARMFRNRPK